MRYIPVGTTIHNVELKAGQGGKIARGADDLEPLRDDLRADAVATDDSDLC